MGKLAQIFKMPEVAFKKMFIHNPPRSCQDLYSHLFFKTIQNWDQNCVLMYLRDTFVTEHEEL